MVQFDVIMLARDSNARGFSPTKVTGVLIVPFRGLNLWIGIA